MSHRGNFYTLDAKLYDPPPHPIPLLTAANGRKSMRLAGQYGDGLAADLETWKQHDTDARKAAELWRFGPKAFKSLYNVRDPAEIQWRATEGTPIEQVVKGWPVGTDLARIWKRSMNFRKAAPVS